MNISLGPASGTSELSHQRARFLTLALGSCSVLLCLQAALSPHRPVRISGVVGSAVFLLILLAWRLGRMRVELVGRIAGTVAAAMVMVRLSALLGAMTGDPAQTRALAVALAVQTFVIPALLAAIVLHTVTMVRVHVALILTIISLVVAIPGPSLWLSDPVGVGGLVQMSVFLCLVSAMTYVLNSSTLQMEIAEGRAKVQSETDPLTGIANRRSLDRSLESLPDTGTDVTGGVLLIDVDHFKVVNDTFGHDAGDRVLVDIAVTMAGVTRPSDTIGRWGGEEFLVLIPETDVEMLHLVAERVRRSVEHLDTGPIGGVTVSVGAALRRPGESTDSLMSRVDRALYVAKQSGRNRTATASRLAGDGLLPSVL